MTQEEDDRARYVAAIERYVADEEFRARVLRIGDLIMRAEGNRPTPESQVGMWLGIAVALHLTDRLSDDLDDLLRQAGIEYPLGLRGVKDLIGQRDGQRARAEEAEARDHRASVDKCPDCLVLVEHDDLAAHRLMIHPWEE